MASVYMQQTTCDNTERSPLWPDEVVQAGLSGAWANVSLNSCLVKCGSQMTWGSGHPV